MSDYINLEFRMILTLLVLSLHNRAVCHLQHGHFKKLAGIFKDIDKNEKVKKKIISPEILQ